MEIKEKIKNLPKKPGIYHFLNENGDVLYVGKAKNLSNRIKQYFAKELNRGPAIEQMVNLASDIKWIETDSEIEAVILEAEVIKKLKPKYNVRLKDDKSFLVIRITKSKEQPVISAKAKTLKIPGQAGDGISNNDFPRVELVRLKNVNFKDKGSKYFGPYPSSDLLRKSLRYLRKIFPYRDCSTTKYKTYNKKGRPCIYHDICVCSGPCCNFISDKEYRKNILYLQNFLQGKKNKVIKSLEKEMRNLSKKQNFEEAAIIRNKIYTLNHIKEATIGLRDDIISSNKILLKRVECYDISNIMGDYAVGSMVVFGDGKPDKEEYKKFKIKGGGTSDLERIREVLVRRFKNDWMLPDLIVIDGGEMQLKVAKEVLRDFKLEIPIVSISKGTKRKNNDFHYGSGDIAKYLLDNIEMQNVCITARDEAHRFAISYYRNLHTKNIFK